ncbi:MAG: electron transfer flavoprotein subunit beta/FixA family protein [Candidatus Marsarchaeota archaeon]|nr:electron transfer flavoprotein subunit beta/FixA family protein [Candidatus Marsarchaeota archaeon]
MNIVVCVKRVPDLAEADIIIDRSQKDIEKDDLVFDLNEWDSYAIEEAVQLKEKLGGSITAVTLGDQDAEEVLRRALAVGADDAIHLIDVAFNGGDATATAKVLAAAIRTAPFDLILTGAQAADDGYGQTGATLAEMLGVPHATLVTNIEIVGRAARVHRELEAGLEEVVEVELPAVLTVQTGINEPRYVSIAGIRRVAKREIKVLDAKTLGLTDAEVGANASKIEVEELFIPLATRKGEVLTGSADIVAEKLMGIFATKGWFA